MQEFVTKLRSEIKLLQQYHYETTHQAKQSYQLIVSQTENISNELYTIHENKNEMISAFPQHFEKNNDNKMTTNITNAHDVYMTHVRHTQRKLEKNNNRNQMEM